MMKHMMIIALLAAVAAQGASTNLNYTSGEINAALGAGLANTNTPARLDELEAFVADSNGFSNIEFSTARIGTALEFAEANSNTVDRVGDLEAFVADSNGFSNIEFSTARIGAALEAAEGGVDFNDRVEVLETATGAVPAPGGGVALEFPDAVAATAFSTSVGTYLEVDLSGIVGANPAMVLLRIIPNGGAPADQWFRGRTAGELNGVRGGTGSLALEAGMTSMGLFVTDADGKLEATSEWPVEIRVSAYIKESTP